RHHVDLPLLDRALARQDEVRDAQEPAALLARERERAPHRRTGLRRFEDVDGVALGDGREVSVYDRGMREDALGRQVLEPVAQPRAPLGLDELLVAGAVAVTRAAQAPLAQER